MSGPLGRRVSPDWEHVEKYPLTALATIPQAKAGVLGINWYPEFDRPVKRSDGHWYVSAPASNSRVRGGHCVCVKGRGVSDSTTWWDFYDQGREGACVGFGSSRMMTLHNRKRYFARWLWDNAKLIDPWPDTNPGDDDGTDVRSALEILRNKGHVPWKSTYASMNDEPSDYSARDRLQATPEEGIAAYRWATSVDDMAAAVGYGDLQYLDIINSWGRSYPHVVRFPLEALERVFNEDGEFGIPTDR